LALAGCANLGQHLINGQHVIAEDVDELVKNQQIVITAAKFLDAEVPGVARGLPILFGVLGVPGEAVAHGVDFNAELLRGDVLAIAVVARLHELNHAAVQLLTGCSHHQSQCARCLTFTVSSVDDEQALSVFLVVISPPFVFTFDRH
jgi:hypothetical protein